MTEFYGFRMRPQLVIGVAAVGLGVLLLLDNLHLRFVEPLLELGSAALLIVVGLLIRRQMRLVGLILTFLGVWSGLARILGFRPWSEELFWPLALVFFGAHMIWGAAARQLVGPPESDSRIQSFALWSGVGRKVSSNDFRSGEVIAVMGGCTIDLRPSFIAQGEADLFVFVMWGAVEILVPEDWAVTCNGIAVMGGFDDATDPPRGGSQQRLVVRGAAVMGAAEVRNHEEEDEEDGEV